MTTTEMGGTTSNSTNNTNSQHHDGNASTASCPTSDDEKSHTFRRRRLSLSRHHIAPPANTSSNNPTTSPASAALAAAAAASLADNEQEEESAPPPLPVVTTTTTTAAAAASTVQGEGSAPGKKKDTHADSDEKAHTFRKRRLSLTLMPQARSLVEDGDIDEEDAEGNDRLKDHAKEDTAQADNGEGKDVTSTSALHGVDEVPPKRLRRASDASSLASLGSSQTGGGLGGGGSVGGGTHQESGLKVRTLHAGEIVNQHARHPPSPAMDPSSAMGYPSGVSGGDEPHVLYRLSRPPSSTTLLNMPLTNHDSSTNPTGSPLPKWRKRITRKHDEDERKLPFPRDIVGTYSCHGVEPVYDSDYDQTFGEEEEDGDDLLRAHGTDNWKGEDDDTDPMAPNRVFPTANTGKPNLEEYDGGMNHTPPREPKPTTAAKINQDRGGVAFPYGNCPKTALFAAYDGHGQGGELVSQFALHEIQSRLEKRPEFNTNLEQAFKDTFIAVDEALQREPLIEPLYAGTTACVALLRDNVLTVANAGDSRAVVARKAPSPDGSDDAISYQAIDLTVDQNPDLPEERERIESMGGFVSPPPEPGLSARVWLDEGFSQIGLAMARSIGDHAVAKVGVIAEPVVTSHTVLPEDEFLIIATDGVWEFLSSEQAVEIVGANLSRGATKATQALIEAAAARWHDEEGDYRDDITALVIRLPELWKQQEQASSSSTKAGE